jgi:type II secretory pathway component GspD/PulD (secretin)
MKSRFSVVALLALTSLPIVAATSSAQQDLVLPAANKSPDAAPATAPAPALPVQPATIPVPPKIDTVAVTDNADPLDIPVAHWVSDDEDLPKAIKLLGHTYGIRIHCDPEVTGKVTFEASNVTVRDVLTQLTANAGCFFEEKAGFVAVRKFKTVLYILEYPQVQRSSSEQSTVTLSGSSSNSANGQNGTGMQTGSQTTGSGNGGSSNDQTSLSIQAENKSDMWADIAAAIKSRLSNDESFSIIKATGLLQVRATPAHHEEIKAFIAMQNDLLSQEVDVVVQVLQVDLDNKNSMGVDWNQISTKVGGLSFAGASSTTISSVGAATLPQGTFTASITAGKLGAMVNALQSQGSVHSKTNGRVTTLNNQAGYITVGREQTFDFINGTYTQNSASTTPITSTSQTKQRNTYTFGVVLKALPYVRQDRSTIIDLTGSISSLVRVEKDADGSTKPVTDINRLNSMLRLRSGEAAIIGGLIQESEGEHTNSVPVLGSIPVLGNAFKTTAKTKTRTELVLIVEATIKK